MLQFLFPCFLLSWVVANIRTESSCCFQKCDRKSGCRFSRMVCPKVWADYCIVIHTHCQELMKSVGSHGSLSLLFMMKFMTAVIVILPQFFVVENPLQFHIYIYAFFSLWVWLGSWWVCSPIMHMAEFVNSSISCSEVIGLYMWLFLVQGVFLTEVDLTASRVVVKPGRKRFDFSSDSTQLVCCDLCCC